MTSNHTCKYEEKGTYARPYQKMFIVKIYICSGSQAHTVFKAPFSHISTYGEGGWRASEVE
jgi:hypothetical protein